MRALAAIPAFNEAESLAATIVELVATCPGVDYLVINDSSVDGTNHVCVERGLLVFKTFRDSAKIPLISHKIDELIQEVALEARKEQ